MAKRSEFVDYLVDQLAALGPVTARAMFGGYGIFCDRRMFGLVADDVLYLKVDDQNRATFEAAGCQPFIYVKNGKPMAMSYYQIPDNALDQADRLLNWANLALAAALRSAQKKPQSRH